MTSFDPKENKLIAKQMILGKEFRVFGTVEEPLFLAGDIAKWIEHSNVTKMLEILDDDESIIKKIDHTNQRLEGSHVNKKHVSIDPTVQSTESLQANTNYTFVNELGVYRILMRSNKPLAKPFQKEVARFLKKQRLKKATSDPLSAIMQMPTTEKQIKRNKMLENKGWDQDDIDIRQLNAKANTRFKKLAKSKGLVDYQIMALTRMINKAVFGMDANELKKISGASKWSETRNILPQSVMRLNLLFIESNVSSKFGEYEKISYFRAKKIVISVCDALKIIDDSSMELHLNDNAQSKITDYFKPKKVITC